MIFPKHLNSLHLTHNQHKAYYETLEQYIARDDGGIDHFESVDDYLEAIRLDEVWELQWYPHTPIGSYKVCASTLEKCLAFALKVEAETE